jgi:hypothetical protein
MTFNRKSALYAATLGFAAIVLLTGCPPDTEILVNYAYNELTVQVTVDDQSTGGKSVVLWPAYGLRVDSDYQWTIDGGRLLASAHEVLKIRVNGFAYEDFEVGDVILSFLLQVDGKEYAGWDSNKYGTADRTLDDQGYGYVVLCEDEDGTPGWHSSKFSTKPSGVVDNYVGVRYTVTITDADVAFVLDEVAFGERGKP